MTHEFIATNRAQFGVLGSNTRREPPTAPDLAGSHGGFSKGNHFRFGYDGRLFNASSGPSSVFWTEYGSPTRKPLDFKSEVQRALREIEERHGKFSLPNTGSIQSEILIRSAAELGLEFDTIHLSIDGKGPGFCTVPHRGKDLRFDVTLKRFRDWLETFARKAANRRVDIGYSAYLGELTDLPHIYDGFFLRLVNLNVDFVNDVAIGPPRWALVDNERYFAPFRHLVAEKRRGIPCFLKYSPELMESFLRHPLWRESLGKNPNARNNAIEEVRILRGLFPDLPERDYFQSPVAYLADAVSEDALFEITGRCERQWFTPLEAISGERK